ncbi:MAG: ribonucrease Y [Chloroflexi bacterium]|nr:MAG: ribonucrease Y [Chloroflexota bacterium]
MLGAIMRLLRGGGPDPREEARLEASRITERAEQEAKSRLIEAQEEVLGARRDTEADLRKSRDDQQRHEDRLIKREESLDRKNSELDVQDQRLRSRQRDLDTRADEIEHLVEQERERLEAVAQLTTDQARDKLMGLIDDEIRDDVNRRVRETESTIKEEAMERARKFVAIAVQRVATEVSTESTVSVVPIPSDEMKGRIIGREGRNIRALELATGCDVIIDDTPDAVTMSAFDPVRRQIGKVALARLVADGRIHPTRIEEQVEKATREIDQNIRDAGEQAALDARCGGLPSDLLNIFGRLLYRTSYGQNQLRHAVETSHLAGMLAEEMGVDPDIARRGALLHDIGKAVDHEVEGTHALIGGDMARRFKLSDTIANCIEAHHDEVEMTSTEAVIVQVCDSISGGRPGARRESADRYIERLRALEEIANSFEGVQRSFAIQAGREVRVIVDPERIDDLESMRLARDISRRIEEGLTYPGQIRVTVLREMRATEVAR